MPDYTPPSWDAGDMFTPEQATEMAAQIEEEETINTAQTAAMARVLHDVKDYGALGNGTTDDTTAIQNAIAAGGVTFFPAGTYIHTGLTLPNGAHLVGVGHGKYTYGTVAPATARSILKLKTNSNTTCIIIPAARSYGIIEKLEIDGNKVGQSATSNGINFSDVGSPEETGWHLSNVELYDVRNVGIYWGTGRQGMYAEHVIVTFSGSYGIQLNGTDSTWIKPMITSSAAAGMRVQGPISRVIGGDVWGQPGSGQPGIIVAGTQILLSGIGIDHHDHEGILLDTGANEVAITGCIFHSNSQTTTNTYSDIKVNVNGEFSIIGNVFGYFDGGITKLRKYAVEVGSNYAKTGYNAHNGSATGTAYSDTPGHLVDSLSVARNVYFAATGATLSVDGAVSIFTGASPGTFTLPPIATSMGITIPVKNNATANLTVQGTGGEGVFYGNSYAASVTLYPGDAMTFVCDQFEWLAVADSSQTNTNKTLTTPTISGVPVFNAGIPAVNLPNGLTNGNTTRQSQATVSGTSYYIAGSNLNLPATLKAGMAVGTRFRWTVAMDKTAAGTGAFAIEIRRGTAGTVSDTADVSQSVGTQTAVVDNMTVDVEVVVTTTGATGAYFWSISPNNKAITATGFGVATGTGAYFSGTVSSVALNTASLIFGLSFKATTGTPTITIPLVRASAINID